MNVAESLTTKLGPLPAWAWGLGLGLGINGLRYWRARSSGSSTAEAAAAQAAALTAADQAAATSALSQVGPAAVYAANGYASPSDGYMAPQATGPGDNDAWRAQAIDRLVGRLGYQPIAVQEAIDKFYAGDPLTRQQEAIVSEAMRALGAPPTYVPPVTRAAAEQTKETPGTEPEPEPAPSMPAPAGAP